MTNLTCCEKSYIYGLKDAGMEVKQIAEKVGMSASEFYKVLTRREEEKKGKPVIRRGRPPKLSTRDKRDLVAYTKRNERATLREITDSNPEKVSKATVRRALREAGVKSL